MRVNNSTGLDFLYRGLLSGFCQNKLSGVPTCEDEYVSLFRVDNCGLYSMKNFSPMEKLLFLMLLE